MSTTAPVTHIAHVNLRGPASLVETLRAFYVDVIGLAQGPRPAMRSEGYWLYAGEHDVIHLSVDASSGDPDAPSARRAGLNHVAFACQGLPAMMQRLRDAGVEFRVSEVDDPQQVQLFLFDPAGARIELNFRGASLPA